LADPCLSRTSTKPGSSRHFHKQAARTRKGSCFQLATCLYTYGRRLPWAAQRERGSLPVRRAPRRRPPLPRAPARRPSAAPVRGGGDGSSRLVRTRPEHDDGQGRGRRTRLAGRPARRQRVAPRRWLVEGEIDLCGSALRLPPPKSQLIGGVTTTNGRAASGGGSRPPPRGPRRERALHAPRGLAWPGRERAAGDEGPRHPPLPSLARARTPPALGPTLQGRACDGDRLHLAVCMRARSHGSSAKIELQLSLG